MSYLLNEKERSEQIAFLAKLGGTVLKKLDVSFTRSYLRKKIGHCYATIFYEGSNSNEATDVADPNEPTNLAIVLLDTLKHYHVKYEVQDFVQSGSALQLAVLTPVSENKDYRACLKLVCEHKHDSAVGSRYNVFGQTTFTNVLAIETVAALFKTEYSGEPGYRNNYYNERLRYLTGSIAVFILVMQLGVAFYNGFMNFHSSLWLPSFLLLLMGMLVTYSLYSIENNSSTSLSAKFCPDRPGGNSCRLVLTSPASKIFGLINMTDIGFVYFSTQFFFLLVSLAEKRPGHLGILFWTSILPLPYSFFSIYYQTIVLKKMCRLCMAVQFLLLFHFVYICFAYPVSLISMIAPTSLLQYAMIALIVGVMYGLYKNYSGSEKKLKSIKHSLSVYESDPQIFEVLLHGQKEMQCDLPGAVILGNPNASRTLVAILSPWCMPCADMTTKLFRLADLFEDKLLIKIFLKPEPSLRKLSEGIIRANLDGDVQRGCFLLKRWFQFFKRHKGKSEDLAAMIKRWDEAHPIPHDQSAEVNGAYNKQMEWFGQGMIPHTPLLIYEGYFLPGQYYSVDALSAVLEKTIEGEPQYEH